MKIASKFALQQMGHDSLIMFKFSLNYQKSNAESYCQSELITFLMFGQQAKPPIVTDSRFLLA